MNNEINNNQQTNNIKSRKCKKCKEQINKDAKICPYCRAKQGPPTWLIIIIAIFVLGILFGGDSDEESLDSNSNTNNTNNTSTKVPETIEYIKVSKDDLDEALENNAASAKDTYKNKYVEVTGKLGTIDSDLSYIVLMSTTNEWDFNGIHCYIKNNEQKNIVKTLSKDQEITIKGKITDVGEVLGYYLNITEIITQ